MDTNGYEVIDNDISDRMIDWDREESDSCQKSTPGCCIDHSRDEQGGCWPW